MRYLQHPSPIGPLLLAGEDALSRISFPTGDRTVRPDPAWQHDPSAFTIARDALDAYFDGERNAFDHVPLELIGTEFQCLVWRALAHIPYGETTTYGALAAIIGRPKAVRAVGAANGANPLPLILPCHRVIGTNGTLTGFGGGLPLKERLLDLEGWRVGRPKPPRERSKSPLPLF